MGYKKRTPLLDLVERHEAPQPIPEAAQPVAQSVGYSSRDAANYDRYDEIEFEAMYSATSDELFVRAADRRLANRTGNHQDIDIQKQTNSRMHTGCCHTRWGSWTRWTGLSGRVWLGSGRRHRHHWSDEVMRVPR